VVGSVARVRRCQREPEIQLTPRALAMLACGSASATLLARLGLLHGTIAPHTLATADADPLVEAMAMMALAPLKEVKLQDRARAVLVDPADFSPMEALLTGVGPSEDRGCVAGLLSRRAAASGRGVRWTVAVGAAACVAALGGGLAAGFAVAPNNPPPGTTVLAGGMAKLFGEWRGGLFGATANAINAINAITREPRNAAGRHGRRWSSR